jgi:tRNA threonylcarbamoyl adenosine modification protein YjeE
LKIFEYLSIKQKSLIDLVIDAGQLPHNPPSTVIDTTKQDLQILRGGAFTTAREVESVQIDSTEKMINYAAGFTDRIIRKAKKKAVLLLFNGELGAGKTQFVKGIARALEIKKVVNSPTFTLIKEYSFKTPEQTRNLIHIDAWRVESGEELQNLGIEEIPRPEMLLL